MIVFGDKLTGILAAAVKSAGLTVYIKSAGKNKPLYLMQTAGIQDNQKGQKFRFETLGVVSLYMEAKKRWENVNKRQEEIRQIAIAKGRAMWREFDFQGDVLGVIEEKREQGGRAEEIRRIVRAKAKSRRERSL